jgi:hypothetical protein
VASSQLKAKRSTIARGDAPFDARSAPAAERRYRPVRPLTELNFAARGGAKADRRRALGLLGLVAIGAVGAVAALIYFAGMIAAAIAAAAVAALVGFGNWILNHTVEL